jgi:hypothetical protein
VQLAVRPYVTAGVALVGSSLIAVTPIAPVTPESHIANVAVRLLADSTTTSTTSFGFTPSTPFSGYPASPDSSILNIPANLFYDVANVPYNAVQALDQLAGSLFFTGNWWVGSSTNIWGEDPGDPGHFESLTNLFVPFPALSVPEGSQLALLAAAELPASSACTAVICAPLAPLQPITGNAALDKTIWFAAILFGYPFPLINNWFQVPLTGPGGLTSGYTFGNIVNPAGPANSGFGFQGTVPGPNGEPLMPWSGTTFTYNPLLPFESFYNQLTAPPPSAANGIQIASGQDLFQALQSVLAGLVVDFNPFIPGSPFCPGQCNYFPATALTTVGLVNDILALDPSNTLIQQWLTDEANGTANGPTAAQTAFAEQFVNIGLFDLSPATLTQINAMLSSINPVLPSIAADSGLLAGYDPTKLLADIEQLLGTAAPAVSSTTAPAVSSTTAPAVSSTTAPAGSSAPAPNSEQPATANADPPATLGTAHQAPTTAAPVPAAGPLTTAPESGEGPHPPSTPVRNHNSTNSTPTNVTSDGNKAVPGGVGGNGTTSGGSPVGSGMSSSLTDGFKSGTKSDQSAPAGKN